MGFRFWRSKNVSARMGLHLSRSEAQTSFGSRGTKFTTGSNSKHPTLGIPGTVLFYSQQAGPRSRKKQPLDYQREGHLDPGFFRDLSLEDSESHFIRGAKALAEGAETLAFREFTQATDFPDGTFMSGVLALKAGDPERASQYLQKALENAGSLGWQFYKYDLDFTTTLPITDTITAFVKPNSVGVRMLLAECYEQVGRLDEALQMYRYLQHFDSDDAVILLAYVELLYETSFTNPKALTEIIQLTKNIPNDCLFHAGIRLYRARALRRNNLLMDAEEVLTSTLRKKKDRSPAIYRELLAERATLFEETGQIRKALQDYAKLEKMGLMTPELAARRQSLQTKS